MFSLFEEQIRHDQSAMDYFMSVGTDSYRRGAVVLPGGGRLRRRARRSTWSSFARRALAVDIPIIASLNGTTDRGWVDFAALMEDAGASGIELNIYYIPTEMHRTGAEVEDAVRRRRCPRAGGGVTFPIAVKVGPYFSSFAQHGGPSRSRRRRRAGALQPLLSAGLRHREAERSFRRWR